MISPDLARRVLAILNRDDGWRNGLADELDAATTRRDAKAVRRAMDDIKTLAELSAALRPGRVVRGVVE